MTQKDTLKMTLRFTSLFLHALPLLLLLLTVTMTEGLNAKPDNFQPCRDGRGSFIDDIICDPDHLMTPEESYNLRQVLNGCSSDVGDLRVLVFLADNFPVDKVNSSTAATATASVNGTSKGSGDRVDRANINLLTELVVSSNSLNSSNISYSVILLVATKDPFQLATWYDASLNDMVTKGILEKAEQTAATPIELQAFNSMVGNVAFELCQVTRWSRRMTSALDVTLTVVWIVLTSLFVGILVTLVIMLVRARLRAVRDRAKARQEHDGGHRRNITSASDVQDLSVQYYKSSGNVLLGTTDITAMPLQDCSSTDNLLQG